MTAADVLRAQLEACGGLVTRTFMAGVWGWTRSHVHNLSMREGFPVPVLHLNDDRRQPLYARHELEHWHAEYVADVHARGYGS